MDNEPKGYGRKIKDAMLSAMKVIEDHPIEVGIGVVIVGVVLVLGVCG